MSPRLSMKQSIGAILDGTMSDEEALRVLSRTDEANITAEQIAGAVEAVMDRCPPFPAFPHAVDCCGTGGDYQHTLNISTATALVAAACGAQVAKHGNRAITSQSGSADVLEALGVNTNLSPEKAEAVLREVGICFLFAPAYHPGFARVAPLRKQIGHRTIFNLLGPLCNPARVDQQLIGVYSGALVMPVAGACNLLGRKHVLVVHGQDGSDELSISTPSVVAELVHGTVTRSEMEPRRVGLPFRLAEALKGGDAQQNAAALLEIFDGVENAYAEAVIFNAAAVLYVAGKAGALRGGATMAREALATGEAKRILQHLIEATNRP